MYYTTTVDYLQQSDSSEKNYENIIFFLQFYEICAIIDSNYQRTKEEGNIRDMDNQ